MAFGMSKVQPLAIADKVRFAELDRLNHVNNKAYMTWFETLRVIYFDLFCAPHYPAGAQQPRGVVRSGQIHFLHEMLMGEDYVATAGISAFRNTSYTIHQEIWVGAQLRATFDCVFVSLRPDGSGQRYPLPDSLKAHFRDADGAIDEVKA